MKILSGGVKMGNYKRIFLILCVFCFVSFIGVLMFGSVNFSENSNILISTLSGIVLLGICAIESYLMSCDFKTLNAKQIISRCLIGIIIINMICFLNNCNSNDYFIGYVLAMEFYFTILQFAVIKFLYRRVINPVHIMISVVFLVINWCIQIMKFESDFYKKFIESYLQCDWYTKTELMLISVASIFITYSICKWRANKQFD